jgi:hypothetical protein
MDFASLHKKGWYSSNRNGGTVETEIRGTVQTEMGGTVATEIFINKKKTKSRFAYAATSLKLMCLVREVFATFGLVILIEAKI